MIASEAIKILEKLIEKHGDLPLYSSEDELDEFEISGIRFEDEYKDEIFDDADLPKRFYVKF
jgi:hypothetical protein